MESAEALATLESRYLDLRRRLFDERWHYYAYGNRPQMDDIAAMLYELAGVILSQDLPDGRRSDVLRRVAAREAVDSHPDIALLVHRLTTGEGYPDPPDDGPLTAARAREPDVIDLIRLRNEVAQSLGADDYASLITSLSGLDLTAVCDLVASIRSESLDTRGQPQPAEPAPAPAPAPANGPTHARALLAQLDLDDLGPRITWHVDVRGFPYDCPISIPDDIRVLLPEISSWADRAAVFHELGHATMHVANEQTGVFTTWNELWDEAMAVTMERIGVALRFDGEAARAQRRIDDAERLRLSTSFLFEIDVITHPERAQDLYRDWYEPLGTVDQPVLWALDTFRVEDPVHVHTYVLGEIVANAIVAYLRRRFGDDHQEWGSWLRANCYADGRASTLFEKLDRLEEFVPTDVADLALASR